jgi:hypothetical protein
MLKQPDFFYSEKIRIIVHLTQVKALPQLLYESNLNLSTACLGSLVNGVGKLEFSNMIFIQNASDKNVDLLSSQCDMMANNYKAF